MATYCTLTQSLVVRSAASIKYSVLLAVNIGGSMIDKFIQIDEGQTAQLGKAQWSVARLITLAKNLDIMNIPLEHLNVYNKYEDLRLRDMVMHFRAVNSAELKYPIILDEDGEIMDGRHRIMKALLENKKTIKAVRFKNNPDPCRYIDS